MAAQGSEAAFAAIFQRHHQSLYRYCRAILANGEDAADAMQNTMVAALRSLPGEQREVALKPWLYRIAHNESISLLRRRRSQTELADEEHLALADTHADLVTKERLRELISDLRELPEKQRGALVMRELSGLDYPEIAGAFGISPAAAKQAVFEARLALHELAEGREMPCEDARRAVSDGDGRALRARRLRAHLRACDDCSSFRDSIKTRSAQLAAVAPPLPLAMAGGLLRDVFGAGNGTGGGGTAVTAGAAKTLGASVGVKLAIGAAAVGIGIGAGGVTGGFGPLSFGSDRSMAEEQTSLSGSTGAQPATAEGAESERSERRRSTGGTRKAGRLGLDAREGVARQRVELPNAAGGRVEGQRAAGMPGYGRDRASSWSGLERRVPVAAPGSGWDRASSRSGPERRAPVAAPVRSAPQPAPAPSRPATPVEAPAPEPTIPTVPDVVATPPAVPRSAPVEQPLRP